MQGAGRRWEGAECKLQVTSLQLPKDVSVCAVFFCLHVCMCVKCKGGLHGGQPRDLYGRQTHRLLDFSAGGACDSWLRGLSNNDDGCLGDSILGGAVMWEGAVGYVSALRSVAGPLAYWSGKSDSQYRLVGLKRHVSAACFLALLRAKLTVWRTRAG